MIHNTIKVALTLPGQPLPIATPQNLKSDFTDLASLISPLLNIAFYIAIFLCFYYLIWGTFQYILASGNKEELGKARARITWALVGLLFIIFSYLLATYGSQIFPSQKGVPF